MTGSKEQINSQWIPLVAAIQLCQDQGLSVTSPGLIYAGKHHQFIRKDQDKFHWVFHREKLQEYIDNAIQEAPPGWITIRQAAEKTGVCVGTVYNWINSGRIKAVQYGRFHLYYVEEAKTMGMKK